MAICGNKRRASALLLVSLLQACGGGGGASVTKGDGAGVVSSSGADQSTVQTVAVENIELQPTFQLAKVALGVPTAVDASGDGLSAFEAPHTATSAEISGADAGESATSLKTIAGVVPLAAATTQVVTYTPAQIRAAYGLPGLLRSWQGLDAATAAKYGAGQTIYIIDAYDNPNALTDLNAFSAQFGLPTCAVATVPTTTTLPLPVASASAGCVFSKVFSSKTSPTQMVTATPTYNSAWATEIALDVQWAHAIAPLARIVLIEAANAGLTTLYNSIQLANAMGPGVVSMSFGSVEGSWSTSYQAAFSKSGMTYFAATGDAGAQVSWPAVSQGVTAVSGTSLTYTGVGARQESVWAKSGGGQSLYTALPTYQSTVAIPGQSSTSTTKKRGVADVAFNANPYTGQYTLVTLPGAKTGSWVSGGGTSLSTPQWAALAAIGNAMRATMGKQTIGANFNTMLYTAAGVGSLLDINTGTNGTCATCKASTGYDLPSGLGTPNATALLAQLQQY